MFEKAKEEILVSKQRKEIIAELRGRIKQDKNLIRAAKKIQSHTDLNVFYDKAEYEIEK